MKKAHVSMFDFAPGKTVAGRFRIVAASRQNDLALTFEVADEVGEPREITFFPPGLFDGPEQVAEFASYWETWKGVDSPHVVPLREILTADGDCALLVTDRPPGGSLRDWLNQHERMDCAQALKLGTQLAEALVEIHSAGLVHGDVKPQTTYVDSAGQKVVLVGGGVTTGLWNAKGLGERTALIGTPYYAPVEQFGGDAPSVQSDVYNVATVLFELVTGVLPWPGKTFLEVFQAKLEKEAPSMAARAPGVEVAPEVERAIVRGLLADRHERYQDATQLLEELSAVA